MHYAQRAYERADGGGGGVVSYQQSLLHIELDRKEHECAALHREVDQLREEWGAERRQREELVISEVDRSERLERELRRALKLNARLVTQATRVARQRTSLTYIWYLAPYYRKLFFYAACRRGAAPAPASAPQQPPRHRGPSPLQGVRMHSEGVHHAGPARREPTPPATAPVQRPVQDAHVLHQVYEPQPQQQPPQQQQQQQHQQQQHHVAEPQHVHGMHDAHEAVAVQPGQGRAVSHSQQPARSARTSEPSPASAVLITSQSPVEVPPPLFRPDFYSQRSQSTSPSPVPMFADDDACDFLGDALEAKPSTSGQGPLYPADPGRGAGGDHIPMRRVPSSLSSGSMGPGGGRFVSVALRHMSGVQERQEKARASSVTSTTSSMTDSVRWAR